METTVKQLIIFFALLFNESKQAFPWSFFQATYLHSHFQEVLLGEIINLSPQ